MENSNQLKWGSALSYIQMALNAIIGVVYTPVMIRILGQSEYGLYSTISSTISMLSVLNLGFNSSYIKYYAKYKINNERDKIFRLNGLFLLIFTILGLIAFSCGIFLATHLELVFDNGLTSEELRTGKVLMLLLTIHLTVSFPMSVFSTIISANERFVFLKLFTMIHTVISPLMNVVLLLMGYRSVGLVVSSLACGLVGNTVIAYYVFFRLRNSFRFGNLEPGLFKSLFGYTFFIALNLIVNEINVGLDRVLIGRFNGTTMVAVYSVGANLYTHYKNVSVSISGVFTPRIHMIYQKSGNNVTRDKELSDLFIKIGRIQFLILMLFASGLVIFGQAFISFWVGEGYDYSYPVLLLLMIPTTVPLIQNIGIEIQRAANKHQIRSIVYAAIAAINVLLTIYLCPRYGAVGAALGTCVSIVVGNVLFMNWFYKQFLNINIPLFWKNIIRLALGMIPAFIVGALIKTFVSINSVLSMIVLILLYTCIYSASVWFFSMNEYEKSIISSPLQRIALKWRRT